VSWHSDVESAWKATQEQGRPLLVFVTRDECFYCTQMKEKTYSHGAVADTINRSYVPLVLDGKGKSQLLKELRVAAYPCTFVISPQAVIQDRIDGYVAPEALASRLNASRPAVGVATVPKGP
jgi:protein disulfide-isomerase